jgi:hypothetical protein
MVPGSSSGARGPSRFPANRVQSLTLGATGGTTTSSCMRWLPAGGSHIPGSVVQEGLVLFVSEVLIRGHPHLGANGTRKLFRVCAAFSSRRPDQLRYSLVTSLEFASELSEPRCEPPRILSQHWRKKPAGHEPVPSEGMSACDRRPKSLRLHNRSTRN